jgi:large subunit ribosomal protein L10
MIAYTVLVPFDMRTVSFLERFCFPRCARRITNPMEVKSRMPNAKVLSEKQAIVASLTEKLQNAAAGLIVDYKGITVAEDTALRAECRKNEIDYAVVKNTLLRFAFNNVGLSELDDKLNGTTSLAVASDPVAPARVIADYAKKLGDKFEIKGGFMDGKVIDMDTINALAAIPALPVLQAQVLGTMLAPISGLACVLKQIAEKNGAPAEEAAEAAAE